MTDNIYNNQIKKFEMGKQLQKLGDKYGVALRNLAKFENKYRVESTILICKLKEQGESISYINSVYKGLEPVSTAHFNYLIAEAEAKMLQENINILKIQIKMLGDD